MSAEHLCFPSSVVIMDVDIMSNEPVMWTTLRGKEGLFPLYTHPPDDTALLRQALDCLENHVMQRTYASGVVICNTAIALRERLGEKT
jgi:hypothetical protein